MQPRYRSTARHRPAATFPRLDHDHAHCVDDAIAAAARVCAGTGGRLTELRRRVLALVWRSHEPVGAYELLDQLARDTGRRAAPPTVYRALEFLLQQGLVHRVESRNAYMGCPRPGKQHLFEILLCTACGCAVEVPDDRVSRAVKASADLLDFEITGQTIEITGRCRDCRDRSHHG